MVRLIVAIAFVLTCAHANAQSSRNAVFNPLYEFDRQFAKDAAAKANCAISVATDIRARQATGGAAVHKWPAKKELYVKSLAATSPSAQFACHWRTKDAALGALFDALSSVSNLSTKTQIEIEDALLFQLDLFAVRSKPTKQKPTPTIEYFGVENRLLFDTVYATHTVLPTGRRGRKKFEQPATLERTVSFEDFVAGQMCSAIAPGSNQCKPAKGKASSFRRAMESLFYEHVFNQEKIYRVAGKSQHEDLPHVSIFDLFVEDLNSPEAIEGSPSFSYEPLRECPASAVDVPSVRSVLNCRSSDPTKSDYRILLTYLPNSSTAQSGWLPVRSPRAPKPTTAAVIRNASRAILDDTFRSDATVFPSKGSFRLAKNPSEFLKSKTEEGATLSIGLDRDGQEDSFEVDAALGYRISNTVKPSTVCKNPNSSRCRVQVSATPFVAWQREQTEDLSVTPAEINRSRDVVFGGVQIGIEQISFLEPGQVTTDHWNRPSWRASLALEAITDGDFDSQVYRAVALGSPAWPKNWPSLGYRQRVRVSDLPLSHADYLSRNVVDQGAIRRCRNRLLCSIWVEWDAAIALEEVAIDEAPFNLSTTDILDDRIFEFDGTRYGYDIGGAIAARAPFAFSGDKPWLEFKVDYKNRQSWTDGGGQAELLETAINLKDTKDGLLSFGIGYERGEDLRLGNDIESWNLKIDLKR